MSIITVTMNPCIDKSTRVGHVVAERKLRCEKPRYEPGGGGINVSRAIGNLGGSSTALYLAGGATGQMLDRLLEAEGIVRERLPMEGLTRENLMVHERGTDQQYRFGMPGPDVAEKEWQDCLKRISGAEPAPDYIVASGSLPPGVPEDFYGRVARLAKKRNIRLIVDTNGPPLLLAVEEGVYMIKPNFREVAALVKENADEADDREELARRVVREGLSEVVILSLGPGGALFVTAGTCERLYPPAVPVKSKVGAGDSMVGGTVFALDRGDSLREAVRFGLAAGAAAVMTPGTELCRREDTERLYQAMSSGGTS